MRDRRARQETTISLDGGKVLTALRSRGLSAAVFAERAGVSPNTMTRALVGRPISTQSAQKIAKGMAATPIVEGLADLLAS
jgi:lambda repressor-like predicted transcriptional regulator